MRNAANFFILFLLTLYKVLSGPFHFLSNILGLPCGCKYPQSCSEYAREQILNEKSLLLALKKISIRFLSCGPWCSYLKEIKEV